MCKKCFILFLAQIIQKSKGFEEVIVKSDLIEDENHSNIEEMESNPLELKQEIQSHSNPKVKTGPCRGRKGSNPFKFTVVLFEKPYPNYKTIEFCFSELKNFRRTC